MNKFCVPLFVAAIILLSTVLTLTTAIPLRPTNCSLFEHVSGGVDALSEYTARLYNSKQSLEDINSPQSIDTNFIKGMEIADFLRRFNYAINIVSDEIKEHPHYPGFNGFELLSFFRKMYFYIGRDICNWLLHTYGHSLTVRSVTVNCNNLAEQAMMGEFAMMTAASDNFKQNFEGQFGCPAMNYTHWINNNMIQHFAPELGFLKERDTTPPVSF